MTPPVAVGSPVGMTDAALTAHDSMPFAAQLGLTTDTGGAGRVVGRTTWHGDRCTVGGALPRTTLTQPVLARP